jgi:hypothetical protein
MGPAFKALTLSAWLSLGLVMAVQPAAAQNRYPSIEDKWDGTDYRAVIQRVKKDGLQLPTLADAATKPVFERMVAIDNIPLHMGLNKELSTTIRFQRLDSALDPVHKLVVLYADEAQKGKPYAKELAILRVYEAKISAAMLNLHEPLLATLERNPRYQARVAELEQMKTDARQLYSGLVEGMTDTRLYAKPDILKMAGGALDELAAYQPIFTNEDRQSHVQKLTQQISTTTDQDLKKALTELRDAIQHGRVRT